MTPVPRNVRLLRWFNFWVDFRPYAPIAILYFSQVSGSFALGMSVYSVATLSQSIFEVPTGIFSDFIGRKRTVVCGTFCAVLSLMFYAIGGVYLSLLVGAIFEGVARAFFSGNNDALLYDTLAETGQQDAYQEYLGKTAAMYQVALAISAVIGGVIAAVSFQAVMWVSVIPTALAFLVSLAFVEPRVHSRASSNVYVHLWTAVKKIAQAPRLRGLTAASVLNFAIGESRWLFRSAFIELLWPVWAIGLAQLIGNVGAALGFYFSGRIIRRFGEFRLLVGGLTLSEATNLFAFAVPTVLSPALTAWNSIFFGVNTVAIGGLLQREFTDEQRATLGSLTGFGGSLVFAVFSLLLGALADRIGPTSALVFATLLTVVPVGLYWWTLRERKAKPEIEAYPKPG